VFERLPDRVLSYLFLFVGAAWLQDVMSCNRRFRDIGRACIENLRVLTVYDSLALPNSLQTVLSRSQQLRCIRIAVTAQREDWWLPYLIMGNTHTLRALQTAGGFVLTDEVLEALKHCSLLEEFAFHNFDGEEPAVIGAVQQILQLNSTRLHRFEYPCALPAAISTQVAAISGHICIEFLHH